MIRNFTLILFLLFLIASNTHAQEPPKREMRASWLTTVWGLDWPTTKIPAGGGGIYIDAQKQQLTRILDSMKVAGMNAVFFQVRSECDAMYKSSYEPWSAHLVETRGMDPGYDPLQFAVEECHKRGLELHAWLNPYRFESVAGKYAGLPGDYRQTHPEWVLTYSGDGSILDPGNPGVRERISDIVKEIILNYDVDGVVFDDYFYAYGGTPASLDQYSQDKWKPKSMDLDDWRRQNVNQMIADVYKTIQDNESWVTFGVSPFGIWTVDPQVAASNGLKLPTGITGMDAYKSIYCDPVAWLSEGTVDYVSPQIYWPTTSVGQDYKKLAPWWSDVVNKYNRHLYVSHSLSNLDVSDYPPPIALKSASAILLAEELGGMSMVEYFAQLSINKSFAGYDPSEFGLQIQWNRESNKNQAPGSVFFRASMFFIKGFINYLRSNEYATLALPPVKSWNKFENHNLPENLRIEDNQLLWDMQEDSIRFVVYAIPEGMQNQSGTFRNPNYLLGMSYSAHFDLTNFQDKLNGFRFAVSVFDRNGNEFPPVIMGEELTENQPANLVSPLNSESVYPGFNFKWEEVPDADHYILEVARDTTFTIAVSRLHLTETLFPSVGFNLANDSVYFWRILARKANANDAVSQTGSFKMLPLPRPQIIYPANETVDVEVLPKIQWEPFDEGFNFRMQISANILFSGIVLDTTSIEGNFFTLPAGTIFPFSTYYLRLQAVNADSTTLWSEVVRFSTVETPPYIPVIISPAEGETVTGPGATLTVETDPLAKSFTFQLSNSSSFPWNSRIQQTVDAPENTIVFDNLTEGTWYAKARANYGTSSYTDWSEVVSFSFLTTSTENIPDAVFKLIVPTVITNELVYIRYVLPDASKIQVIITDLAGRKIQLSQKSFKQKGEHTLSFSGAEIPRGLYLLTFESKFGRKTVKLVK